MENIKRGVRQIDRCARVYTAKAVRHTGLNPSELQALRHLTYHVVCNQQELSDDLSIDKAAASRLAAGLEQKGYVTREADPQDGRSKLIRVTPAAEELVSQLVSQEDLFYQWLLAELDEGAAEQFCRTLERLRQRAVQERKCCYCHLSGQGGGGSCT